MTRIYAEAPFVWQLVLRQEHAAVCEQLVTIARSGSIELALPLVALIETLNTVRLRTNKQNELNNSWSAAARELVRSGGTAYQDAARALQEALLKTAEMASDERRNLNHVIAQLGSCAQILLPTANQFATSYLLEAKGSTPLDALALACILEDARGLDGAIERALLALDNKAISPAITDELKAAHVKVFWTPAQLAPWLASKGVPLTLSSSAEGRGDTDGGTDA